MLCIRVTHPSLPMFLLSTKDTTDMANWLQMLYLAIPLPNLDPRFSAAVSN